MNRDFPLYEGDSVIRSRAPAPRPVSASPAASLLQAAGKEAFVGPYVDFVVLDKSARRHRAEVIWGLFARMFARLFARLFDRVDARVRRAKYREVETYLAGSTDLADLERRMRRMGAARRNLLAGG